MLRARIVYVLSQAKTGSGSPSKGGPRRGTGSPGSRAGVAPAVSWPRRVSRDSAAQGRVQPLRKVGPPDLDAARAIYADLKGQARIWLDTEKVSRPPWQGRQGRRRIAGRHRGGLRGRAQGALCSFTLDAPIELVTLEATGRMPEPPRPTLAKGTGARLRSQFPGAFRYGRGAGPSTSAPRSAPATSSRARPSCPSSTPRRWCCQDIPHGPSLGRNPADAREKLLASLGRRARTQASPDADDEVRPMWPILNRHTS